MNHDTNTDPRPDPHARRNRDAMLVDIKVRIAAGTYESDAKLDPAVDRMIAAHVPAYRHATDPEPRAMTWADAFKIHTAAGLGWRPPLTFPRLADDAGRDVDVPGQMFIFQDEGSGAA